MYKDFLIESSKGISAAFLNKELHTFSQAAMFVKDLPYKRNTDKSNLLTVFSDGHGTCGTKHALLKQLADENDQEGFDLVMGIYKMNGANTARVAGVLNQYKLDYIPEAHVYLKYEDDIIDCTNSKSSPEDFIDELLEEMIITPDQVSEYKVAYHKSYLQKWLTANPDIPYTLDELWAIRENCIKALS